MIIYPVNPYVVALKDQLSNILREHAHEPMIEPLFAHIH
jgi:hypothetical protein